MAAIISKLVNTDCKVISLLQITLCVRALDDEEQHPQDEALKGKSCWKKCSIHFHIEMGRKVK
jgi:hypothetical protein